MNKFLIVLFLLTTLITMGYQIEVTHDQHNRTYFNPVEPGGIFVSVSVEKNEWTIPEKVFIVTSNKEFELSYLRDTEDSFYYRTKVIDSDFEKSYFRIIVEDNVFYLGQNGMIENETLEPY
ncbi:MAG: hypothetical protein ACP5D6_02985 [Kosmotogaceae bacterium]